MEEHHSHGAHHPHAAGTTTTFERPRRSTSALDVDIDGHRLVYDTVDRSVRLLDPLGAVIWSVLDGSASVDELSDELSAAFAVPRDQMVADLTGFVHQLGHNGLLDGSRTGAQPDLSQHRVVLPNPPSP